MNDVAAGSPRSALRLKASEARDRRETATLKSLVDQLESEGEGSQWVAAQRAFCEALEILAVPGIEKKVSDLADKLADQNEFALARRLLEREIASHAADRAPLNVLQKLALYTYKDEERVPWQRLAAALDILNEARAHHPDDPETMGLLGAVYKRRWELNGGLDDLHTALQAYTTGWKRWPERDLGYCGVNAAFLLDVLAARGREVARRVERRKAPPVHEDSNETSYETRAVKLRRELLEALPKLASEEYQRGYWYAVTMAEIEFGLARYESAGRFLAEARARESQSEWKQQTTAKQFAAVFAMQAVGRPSDEVAEKRAYAMDALGQLLTDDLTSALSTDRGKVGLALSGGGFRAALFHLGVLARLAEVGALQTVEVISTVSGGSIVGAHYYKKLKSLLESKPDVSKRGGAKPAESIQRDDYVALVAELIREFLPGVQANVRMRTLANLGENVKMLYTSQVSRSTRLADLYDRFFYGRSAGPTEQGPLSMHELLIRPHGQEVGQPFNPRTSNWRRSAKVPILLLNATPLNTGHGWHFTARWMGEPPGLMGPDVDVSPRYRRLYYTQAPSAEHRNYRLAHAVAASACVPGLFAPLVLDGLYPERRVLLVDGGVHDNQGVEGLLDEGCRVILCSDASGQIADAKSPAGGLVGVLSRTNSILMARVREAEYLDLNARTQNRALDGLMFVHLKKDLTAKPVPWTDCQDPTPDPPPLAELPYGIHADVQRKLAAVRTDLDAFSEIESYALMLSGYLMTKEQLGRLDRQHRDGSGDWSGFKINAPRLHDWPFLKLEALLKKPADDADSKAQRLHRHLEVASQTLLKLWHLDPVFRYGSLAAIGVVLALLAYVVISNWHEQLGPYAFKSVILAVGVFLVTILVPAARWLDPRKAAQSVAFKAVLATLGWVVCNVYVAFLNRRFLKLGALSQFVDGSKNVRPDQRAGGEVQ